MEVKGLVRCSMALRAGCPQCGSSVIIDKWNIIATFNPNIDTPSLIGAKNLKNYGVALFGTCPTCSKVSLKRKESGISSGVIMICSLNEFSEIVSNSVAKFVADPQAVAMEIDTHNGDISKETTH